MTVVSIAPEARMQNAELLRRLSLNDERATAAIMNSAGSDTDEFRLDDKSQSLLRIAALIASDSAGTSYQWAVSVARAAGAADEEIISVLCSVAPIVGSARVTVAAPTLAAALGYSTEDE
jgi:alkylhydroperoxidase/carboxymuconolactone decarboxylase family protein YurZ